MFPVGQVLNAAGHLKYGWVLVLLSVVGAVWVGAFAAHDELRRGREEAERHGKALQLWLSECPHALDQCVTAWDEGSTLKWLYLKRLPQPPVQGE